MKINEQRTIVLEKKRNRALKSNRNRDSLPRIEYYIENEEIQLLYNKIISAFSYEGLTGWEMTFMESILKKLENKNNGRVYFTHKQVEPIEKIIKYPLLDLSPEKQEEELRKGLNIFFKKVK